MIISKRFNLIKVGIRNFEIIIQAENEKSIIKYNNLIKVIIRNFEIIIQAENEKSIIK